MEDVMTNKISIDHERAKVLDHLTREPQYQRMDYISQ